MKAVTFTGTSCNINQLWSSGESVRWWNTSILLPKHSRGSCAHEPWPARGGSEPWPLHPGPLPLGSRHSDKFLCNKRPLGAVSSAPEALLNLGKR